MNRLLQLAALLAAAVVAVPAPRQAEESGPPATTQPAEPPQRVILRVNRNLEVSGTVELEEQDVIVVRQLDGEIASFAKSWLLKIVRLVDPEPGQEGVVRLRNGQRTEGVVIRDDYEEVVLEVEGIRVRFDRSVVDEVILEPTFQQRYDQFKASIQPQMHERRLALCRWLVGQRRYELAREELEALLEDRPDMTAARELRTIVDAQLDLQRGALAPPHETRSGRPERESGPIYDADLLPEKLISHEDVNLIRVYEIDFNAPPKVAIEPDTIRRLLERYGSSTILPTTAEGRTALFRAEPIEIVKLMFQLRARDLYGEVQVISEPHALNIFRQRVHDTWLMNGCATARCHGGPYGGRLFLHRRHSKNARVRLTNLLILERLEIDPQWPLVNYDDPMESLIVQHGLPREMARKPHPDVRGWSPAFTRGNQRLLRWTVEWIESMLQPRPQYPVDYEPPVVAPPKPEEEAPSGLDEPQVDR